MASGDYETEVGVAETLDEIGSLAASTRLFRQQLLAGEQAREAYARARDDNLRLVESRARKVDELTGRFDADMSGALTIFADSVQTLMFAAEELDTKASETSERSVRVASASQQTNTNVQIVASATEELSLSIEEIVGQVSRASRGMDRIALTLHDVEQAATAMSAALEQQGAAARNIARSVQEAASGVEQVDANIAQIEESSARARDQVQSVIGAATLFSERAGSVRGSVDEFLSSIKAA